jgi:hypothetical protein
MTRRLRTPSRRPGRDRRSSTEAAVSPGRYAGHPRCLGREPEVIRVRSASPSRGGLRTTVACQQSRTGSERVMPRAAPLRLHGWQYRSECCCVSSRCGRKRSDASTGRWAWTAEALGHTPRGVSAPLRAPLGARRRSRSRSSASLLHRRPRSRHQLRNAQLRLIIETCQGRPAILALAAGTSVGLRVNRGHALLLPSTTGTVAGAPLRSARWLPRWTQGAVRRSRIASRRTEWHLRREGPPTQANALLASRSSPSSAPSPGLWNSTISPVCSGAWQTSRWLRQRSEIRASAWKYGAAVRSVPRRTG